jgi:hypothetical protein
MAGKASFEAWAAEACNTVEPVPAGIHTFAPADNCTKVVLSAHIEVVEQSVQSHIEACSSALDQHRVRSLWGCLRQSLLRCKMVPELSDTACKDLHSLELESFNFFLSKISYIFILLFK